MSNWQPIEAAPADLVVADLWVVDPDKPEGYRVANCYLRKTGEGMEWFKGNCAICAWKDEATGEWRQRPTHWMPLPEPPRPVAALVGEQREVAA